MGRGAAPTYTPMSVPFSKHAVQNIACLGDESVACEKKAWRGPEHPLQSTSICSLECIWRRINGRVQKGFTFRQRSAGRGAGGVMR